MVKKWAKETGISDSRSGHLPSYADVVMWKLQSFNAKPFDVFK